MSFTCRLCSKQFDTIPDNGTPIGRKRRGGQLWRIDGQVHDLKLDRVRIPRRHGCTRWHKQRGIVGPNCNFCQMDAAPKPEITPTEVILEIAKGVLQAQSTPQSELPKPEPVMAEPEHQPEPETTMAAAFKRSRKS